MSDATQLNDFLREQARKLRADDRAPTTRPEWMQRRQKLRQQLLTAIGSFPEKPAPLEPKILGTLKREGYRIEKLIFQSWPDVWVTASAYVPEPLTGKTAAVLVVHGHWAGARRDPVVQARCLGLVKLGFFVLAVDAFAAGERHPRPARNLSRCADGQHPLAGRPDLAWLAALRQSPGRRLPARPGRGRWLKARHHWGLRRRQPDDVRRRLDERFQAVVPVCSVGNYQAYLRAACCVCEVVPGRCASPRRATCWA